MPNDLVRGRRAVGHEEAMIRMEDACSVQFRFGNGAGMVQQLAKLVDRVADVGTQHVFTEKLMEHLPHRAFQEGHAARMPWEVPETGRAWGRERVCTLV